ncbi:right-handed parallel beta-helix repeat-containing protein [Marinobacter sp. F4218]|uniref:right-handed parallel beta-helix repeat-containing protein n=1 Tax=Marinobacter sp. F4218 TaxID=2862868 RepID=UPI001C62D0CB|nr:right-handed parallel beta-helix repeat-containing protein [Marinobacter sp. F4218]MBW7471054.1 right-handed parallel beta-helix repeat-containing protein [Marinobacter sp. F4218]
MKTRHSLVTAAIAGLMSLPVYAQLFEVSTSREFQSALSAAASNSQNDTIVLSAGIYAPTTPGQPFVYNSTQGDDLRIEAETPGEVLLDGQSRAEILYLNHDSTNVPPGFSIKGIRFQNGRVTGTGHGGALTVLNTGLLLDRTAFAGNTTDRPNSGSAVLMNAGDGQGELRIINSQFVNNVVDVGSPSSNGSAIFLFGGSFAVTDSEFVGNRSDSCGVIYTDSTLDSSVTGSDFRSNRAARGAAICSSSGLLTISGSEFRNNEATGEGGAILGFDGRVLLENSTLANNRADSAGALMSSAVELRRSVVLGNTASRLSIVSADRDLHAENSLFELNQVPDSIDSGTVRCERACRIVNSVFERNTGAPSIKMVSGNADNLVVANSLLLAGNASALAFADANVRATVLNNYISPALLPLPESQIDQQGNILDQAYAGLDPGYHPLEGSILVDAGTSEAQLVALAETDVLGNPRIAGADVDIGWVEYGSSPTAPVVSGLALETLDASNLDSLSFSFNVELAEGRSLVSTELWTDEEPDYVLVSPQGGSLGGVVFMNGGAHQIRVRVTDSQGERSEAGYSFTLNSLGTETVVLRVEDQIRAACAEDLTDCGVDVDAFVAQAIEEARSACKSDPSSCQIETGSFDPGTISAMARGDWNLYGTGRDITDLATVFADARVVWFHNGGTWEAFSTQPDVISVLNAKGIPRISKIPAGRGFWVRK